MGNLGFIINCRGDYYSLVAGHANALEPGKRPRSTLQGTLVTKDGEFFMTSGCPGGDNQAINTMQTLLNIVDFNMNVQQAIEAPRWTTRAFPSSPYPPRYPAGHHKWKIATGTSPSRLLQKGNGNERRLFDRQQRGDRFDQRQGYRRRRRGPAQ